MANPIKNIPTSLRRRIEEMEKKLDDCQFYVLVWGPGDKDASYSKRVKIKEHLIDTFGKNRVFFSEDSEFSQLDEQHGNREAELLEVLTFDAIIILDVSPGSHTELAIYERNLIGKCMVFAPDKYRRGTGFAGTVYDVIKTEWYSEEEFEECDNIRDLALRFATGLRSLKVNPDSYERAFQG